MRDNGPRRGVRIRRSYFYLLLLFFVSLPCLCILLLVECYSLWQDNALLRENMERVENEVIVAETRASRLETLEELLREENLSGREILAARLAKGKPVSDAGASETPPAMEEGPGHEEFPALESGRVRVSDVRARVTRGHSLRISLDLRNLDAEEILSGEVAGTLATADGKKYELAFTPKDAGRFRINRFKRAVLTAAVPRSFALINSEVVIEIKNDAGEPIYRNIFAVMR